MNNEDRSDMAMLLIRVMLGVVFAAHGAQKLFGMFNGIGLEGTARVVEGIGGMSHAYLIASVWGAIEFIAGIFLILGILVRLSAGAIALTMFIRMWKINLMYGFFIQDGGIEYNLLVIAVCIPLIFVGGGRWSVWDL